MKSNKNDYRDAEAIAEAVERENMRFVLIKTEDQLDVQTLHRVRERLVSRRTSVINQIRAFLLERGISFAQGPASLRRQMPEMLENADEKLTARMRRLLDFLWQEWKHLQLQIESLSEDLEQIAHNDAACVRLQQIPGVGLSLPGSPFSWKVLNLRRGVVGCNGMFVLLASLLLSLRGCLQTRAALHAENLALRHQLLLLQRVHQNRRLRLRSCDRLVWVWLSRVWSNWRSALRIVKPETVIAWHRQGFRLYW